MKKKQLLSILTGSALLLSLAACGTESGSATATTPSETARATQAATTVALTGEETALAFSDSGISVTSGSSNGFECEGTALTIDAAGTYVLSGSCADGSVKVKKGTTGVTLVLNGLTLTSSNTAPIACNKSTEVTVVAAAGTENTLTDAAENNNDDYPDNENAENAVIKCKDGSTVTLCGTGTLTLNANGKNGIKSGATTDAEGEASLTIRELTLNINAAANGAVNAEQYLAVESGALNLAAAGDALHCDLTMDVGAEGTDGPTIKITEAYEGIEAATLNIQSGDISILCTDDCMNVANSDLDSYDFSMNISGGTIVAYTTEGDGFDSNGSLTISGGNVTVWTASSADNQPLDADGTFSITGGTVLAGGGSAGMGMNLSATQAYVTFGSTGMGGMGDMGGQPGGFGSGMQPPQSGSGQPGSDSQSGGNVPSDSGMQPGGNAPSGSGILPGGNAPSDSGIQPGGIGNALISSGSTVSILDASGNVVSTGEAPCNAAFVFFSSPDLNTDESYTLSADGASAAAATAQTGTSSAQFGGGQWPGNEPPAAPGGKPVTIFNRNKNRRPQQP